MKNVKIIISIWFPKKKCYHYNGTLQKYKRNRLLTQWWRRFLRDFRWSLARRYIKAISIYNLSILRSKNINRFNKRKWFLTKTRSRRYPAETTTNADYAYDLELQTNTSVQAKYLPLEQAAKRINLDVNADKRVQPSLL